MAAINVRNRTIFHGDNLLFLRGINSDTVHLIATDPPFKKGRDFHATPGSLAHGASFKDRWSWEKDVQGDWVDKIKDDWPAVWAVIESTKLACGEDMAAFLCWLGVRLTEMHRILRGDGSLYLHIDHTAHAYVKSLMDGIFGAKNFRNEIVWCYTGPSNTKRWFPRKHDIILFYAKSSKWTFNMDAVRVPYSDDYVKRFSKQYNEGSNKSAIFTKGHDTKRNQELAQKGKLPEDWWDGFSPVGRKKYENTGYPTQKPLALYDRIIKASSNEGDWVLDPFCGCATTPIAAERLGRRWIGMDIWDEAHDMVLRRLADNGLAVPDLTNKTDQPHLMTFGDVAYSTIPPERTDDNEIAAPQIKRKIRAPQEAWEKWTHKQMRQLLARYQSALNDDRLVTCAGCGRELEQEFMELDHIMPKSDGGANHIANRILICRPCNGVKHNGLTLTGLRRANTQKGWMKDLRKADWAKAQQIEAVTHAKLFPKEV